MRPSDVVNASPRPARAARDAMRPSHPASTPTSWPARRDGWWWRHPRNRAYVLFGLGSLVVMAEAAVLLAGLWALGGGPEGWERFLARLGEPAPRLLHVLAFLALTAYGARFLRLFPKTQTPRLKLPGVPERLRKRPPLGVFTAVLYLTWFGAWLLVGSVLGGALG
jgi:fumarate reductase subunit C